MPWALTQVLSNISLEEKKKLVNNNGKTMEIHFSTVAKQATGLQRANLSANCLVCDEIGRKKLQKHVYFLQKNQSVN